MGKAVQYTVLTDGTDEKLHTRQHPQFEEHHVFQQ